MPVLKNSDYKLVQKIRKSNCSLSLKILRNKHIGLLAGTYGRYSKILSNFNFHNEDFTEEIDLIIYRAAESYKVNKGMKFSTYLCNSARYYCLNKINELKRKKEVGNSPESITALMDKCFNTENDDKNKNLAICDYIYFILEQISDKRIKEIFRLRFLSDKKMTFKEIGNELNLSSQTIINLLNKSIKFIQLKLKGTTFDKI